jgi:TPP-dependent pyruvate/acetoin dehydrogenase alpha subunit
MEDLLSETGFYENPLVPNKKLRQMYVAMSEARVLDEHIAKLQRRVKNRKGRRGVESIRGQEACRVSTAIDLVPGDLVSDSQAGVVMNLLAGEKIDSLLERLAALDSGKEIKQTKAGGGSERLLPWIEDAGERLRMAMGAALSFKTLGRANVVIAYVRSGTVAKGEWRQVLGLASKLELPIIFVVLPAAKGEKRDGMNLSAKTTRWGVPGIRVDMGDAVALYRVAQESLGRTRNGDGPVLIECIEYVEERRDKNPSSSDPLVQMKDFLLSRKVGTKAWLAGAGNRVLKRISAAKR